jgi:endonuclease G, mitochondrial
MAYDETVSRDHLLTPMDLVELEERLVQTSEALHPELRVNIYSELLLPNVRDVRNRYTHPLLAWEALAVTPRFILRGLPGGGKTTALRRLFAEHRDAYLAEEPEARLPLYWQLRDWRGGPILDVVIDSLIRGGKANCDIDMLYAAIANGQMILLLDGVDEVGPSLRPRLEASLRELVDVYPQFHVGVTCRSSIAVCVPTDFAEFELLPLNEQQVREVLFRQAAALGLDRWVTERIHADIHRVPYLEAIARNPMLISALVLLYASAPEVPRSAASLVLSVMDAMVRRWDVKRGVPRIIPPDSLWYAIGRLAYRMLDRGESTVRRTDVLDLVQGVTNASQVVDDLTALPIFERTSADEISFRHVSFRDVCAAQYAAGDPAAAATVRRRASEWPDVVTFLDELHGHASVPILPDTTSAYHSRAGYDPNFLGYNVPLPRVVGTWTSDVLLVAQPYRHDLQYEHFSVIMSTRRRYALCSAANVNLATAQRLTGETAKPQLIDPRIAPEGQLHPDMFDSQRFFAMPLNAVRDVGWGATAERARRDVLHVTNWLPLVTDPRTSDPGIEMWNQIVGYIASQSGSDGRLSIFTGPILSVADPVIGAVHVPRGLWRIVAYARRDGTAGAAGFLLHGATSKLKMYQVSIQSLSAAVGLEFGIGGESDAADFRTVAPLRPIKVHETIGPLVEGFAVDDCLALAV